MMIGLILLGLLFILFGILEVMFPEKVLRFSDYFRVKKGAEYTDFAIFSTRFAGIFMVIGGIVLIVLSFKLQTHL